MGEYEKLKQWLNSLKPGLVEGRLGYGECLRNLGQCVVSLFEMAKRGVCVKTRSGVGWCYKMPEPPDSWMAVEGGGYVGVVFTWPNNRHIAFLVDAEDGLVVDYRLSYGTTPN